MNLLEDFRSSLTTDSDSIINNVAEYIDWMVGRQDSEFTPTNDDEIDLRAYLLHLRVRGVGSRAIRLKFNALRSFYQWIVEMGLIEYDPFSADEFDRPILTQDEIRRRKNISPAEAQKRELTHLRSLHELAQQLNNSNNVRAALDRSLETLALAMNLQTAWMYVIPDIYHQFAAAKEAPPHDFVVAATYGLPPGLLVDKPCYLCQPPDCHCQELARVGRLRRAVNVVECTRLQDSARADGDNRGLFFHASTPLIASDRLLGIINVATDEWQFFTADDLQFLSTVGSQIAVTLEWAYLYDLARAQRERLERELEMAREVQASLLPQNFPDVPGYELAACWRAAREVAGDFYDVFPLSEGCLGLVIGDVSDKGAPAALYMTMVHSLIHATTASTASPADTLLMVNESLVAKSASDMFVSVFLGVLELETGLLNYANAGHDPPFLCRCSGNIERLVRTGPILGVFEGISLAEKTVCLTPGDALLAYTDGVTDALNADGLAYGAARFAAVARKGAASADNLLAQIEADLSRFIGSELQTDDITTLIIRSVN